MKTEEMIRDLQATCEQQAQQIDNLERDVQLLKKMATASADCIQSLKAVQDILKEEITKEK